MYAETFKVPAALETPAKWARWAQQALSVKKLQDAEFNLQQFWKAIQPFKAQASTPAQWAPVLTLDSFSQFVLAGLQQARQIETLGLLNTHISARNLGPKILVPGISIWSDFNKNVDKALDGAINWAYSLDPYVKQLQAKLQQYKQGAAAAMSASQKLAQQAADAERRAKTSAPGSVASNLVSLTTTGPAQVQGFNSLTTATQGRITQTQTPGQAAGVLLNEGAKAAGGILGSIPWWVWAAGGLVLAVLLTKGTGAPAVVISEMRRRTA